MKKFTSTALAVLLFAMSGCSSSGTTDSGKYTAGTYTAEAQGFGGPVTVSITTTANEVTDVTITGDNETPSIGGAALEELTEQVKTAESGEIDGVSGATITSDAVKEAANAAFAEAKGETVATDEEEFVAGTYSATATGFHGDVTVNVTLEDNEIKAVEIEGSETKGVGSVAIDTLGDLIVEANSTDIQLVTGATVTSNAIVRAANEAIAASHATLEKKDIDTTSTEPSVVDVDVVVIGSGGAGMAAAATAAQNGANVVVLEKLGVIGGNTIVSGGFPNFTPTDLSAEGQIDMPEAMEEMLYTRYLDVEVEDEDAKALQDLVRQQYEAHKAESTTAFTSPELQALYTYIGGGQIDDLDLIMTFALGGDEAFEWLASLPEFADKMYLRKGMFMNGTGNGGYWMLSGMMRSLTDASYTPYDKFIAPTLSELEANGGRIVTDMTAQSLIVDDNGTVTGVVATDVNGEEHTYNASKGVIIATGGFGANAEMVKAYADIDITRTTDMRGTTGDGILLATEIGANTTDMEHVQLHMHGNPENGLLSEVHGSTTNPIYVNIEGKRFVTENGTRAEISNATLEQTGQKMYSIFDSQNASDAIEAAVGTEVYKADTLEELAEMVGIDAEQLIATVEEYNEAVRNGTVDQLEPAKYAWGNEINEAPFYCTPLAPTVHHTMGGLTIDTETHVLDTNGNIIDGLFAAGEVVGGIHGANRGAGQALADVVIFGHIAGQTVTAE